MGFENRCFVDSIRQGSYPMSLDILLILAGTPFCFVFPDICQARVKLSRATPDIAAAINSNTLRALPVIGHGFTKGDLP